MSLGENIYALRTEKKLSQTDLAEALEVSRQSVSKWENDNAVPDLERLVKMAELFGVSLDELVTGNQRGEAPEREAVPAGVSEEMHRFTRREIVGIIFFCAAGFIFLYYLLGHAGAEGLVMALPLVLCGVWFFTKMKHPGLWSVWTLCLPLVYTPFQYYFRFNIGRMLMLALYIPLLLGTVWCLRRDPVKKTKLTYIFLGIGYVLILFFVLMKITNMTEYTVGLLDYYYDLYQMLVHGVEATMFLLLTALLSVTQRILREK